MSIEAEVVGEREASDAARSFPRRDAGGPGPLWRKAPFVLRRFPAVAFAVAAAAALLAVTAAAGPLFLSAAGSAALEGEIERTTPTLAGLSILDHADIDRTIIARRDRMVIERAREVDGLGPPLHTIVGSQAILLGSEAAPSRLVVRPGALQHVERLTERAPGGWAGVWLASSTAERLSILPGELVTIEVGGRSQHLRVAGLYRELVLGPRMPQRDARFWAPLSPHMASSTSDIHPPPFMLVEDPDVDRVLDLYEGLRDAGEIRWEFPLADTDLTLPEAKRTAAGLRDMLIDLDEASTPVGGALPFATESTSLPDMVQRSEDTVVALQGSVGTVSLAGRLLAMGVMAAAGLFLIQRRRVEVTLLQARGLGPTTFGARSAVEALIPAAVGALAGMAGAVLLVRSLGPSPLMDAAATRSAQVQAVMTVGIAVALLGVVAAFAAREEHERAGPARARAGFHWEWVVLALAGASLSEILTRGGGPVLSRTGSPHVDPLLLLFPILFVAGGAGLASRLLERLLPRVRAAATRRGAALFLAARRIASSSRAALLLVTTSATAFGILVYAGVLVASQRSTADAKAYVFTGSDVAVTLPLKPQLPEDLPFPATRVTRLPDVGVGAAEVPVLAIDPTTFQGTVRWRDSFADQPLADLLAPLAGGPELPVLSIGEAGSSTMILDASGFSIPARRVGTARAFPGMPAGGRLLVVDHASLEAALAPHDADIVRLDRTEELWGRGEPQVVLRAMREAGVPIESSVTTDDVRAAPGFLALSWTFGFLQALGIIAAMVALVGVVLYLQTRQRAREVAYALARRMGLTRGQHRRAAVAELLAMLGAALLIGAVLAGLGAWLVYQRLDPLPDIPPAPLWVVPWPLLGGVALGALIASWGGAWWVQRAADRARVGEVMRLAG